MTAQTAMRKKKMNSTRPRCPSVTPTTLGLIAKFLGFKKAATIAEMKAHAYAQPEQSYRQLAASFGMSEISVKRYLQRPWPRKRLEAWPKEGRGYGCGKVLVRSKKTRA
jgi:hypothetical protein